MPSIEQIDKPTQAGWTAKATVSPSGDVQVAPAPAGTDHMLKQVEVAWYDDDRVKVTIKDGGPAVIRQAYLTGHGRPVIIDIVAEK